MMIFGKKWKIFKKLRFSRFFEIFEIFDIFENFRFFRKLSIGHPIENFRKNQKFSKI